MSVVRTAKYLLDQAETSQYTAVIVLKEWAMQVQEEILLEIAEVHHEIIETQAEIMICSQQFAMIVVMIAKYHSDQQERNLSIAVDALKKEVIHMTMKKEEAVEEKVTVVVTEHSKIQFLC
jgi:hypothetical protein